MAVGLQLWCAFIVLLSVLLFSALLRAKLILNYYRKPIDTHTTWFLERV